MRTRGLRRAIEAMRKLDAESRRRAAEPTVNRCIGCGYEIAPGEILCGECSCEDDCAP